MSALDIHVDDVDSSGMVYATEHSPDGRLLSEDARPADLQPVYLDDEDDAYRGDER